MPNAPLSLNLRFVDGQYAVARLSAGSPIPNWASGSGFSAIVRADDELTIVCSSDRVPDEVDADAVGPASEQLAHLFIKRPASLNP